MPFFILLLWFKLEKQLTCFSESDLVFMKCPIIKTSTPCRRCYRANTLNIISISIWRRYSGEAGWVSDERGLTNDYDFLFCSCCPHWTNQSHFRCWKHLEQEEQYECDRTGSWGHWKKTRFNRIILLPSQYVTLSNKEPTILFCVSIQHL